MKEFKLETYEKHNKRLKIIRRIVSLIIYIITIPILLFNIILLVKSGMMQDGLPSVFGYKTLIVSTGSMEPVLNIGDVIIIKEVEEEKIRENDIITFNESNAIITHRVIEKTNVSGMIHYTTKGDNNNTNDANKILYSNIEGIVKLRIPKLGTIVKFIQTPLGIAIMATIVGIVVIYNIRVENRKTLRKQKRKLYEENQKK